MSQSTNRIHLSGKGSRLIRRLILAFGVCLVVGGVCLVQSQITNRLTLINDSPEPLMFGRIEIQSKDQTTGEWLNPTYSEKNHVMPPHTRRTLTYNGRHARVTVFKQTVPTNKTMNGVTMDVSWGVRTTHGWGVAYENLSDYQDSTLRRWFDWISPRLPLPASWRE